MTQILNKSAWLEQIERERAIWEQLRAEVGEARMLQPGATGGWTFKDIVVHLNGWRSKTVARLEAAQHGREPAAPPWPAQLDEDDNVDEINNWIYQASRDRFLRAVLDEYSGSFQRMRDAVATLSERDLTEPGRYPWLNGYALADVLIGSFEHFHDDHEQELRAWPVARAEN